MDKIKQRLWIAALFAALLALVCGPLALMELRDSRMFDKPSYYTVPGAELGKKTAPSEETVFWRGIGAIKDDTSVVQLVDASETVLSMSSADNRQTGKGRLLAALEEQLAKMTDFHCIPALSFSGKVKADIYKELYLEKHDQPENRSNAISVWVIHGDYETFQVDAYMDTETNALYDVVLVSKNGGFTYEEMEGDGFLAYLKTFADIPEDMEETFFSMGRYEEDVISLYLASVNEPTGRETFYCFHQDTDQIQDRVETEASVQ